MRAWLADRADHLIGTAVRLTGLARATPLSVRLAERIEPVHERALGDGRIRFSCPNWMTYWRAKSFLTKEPETLAWIASFAAGDTMFDVGANIGLYTVYAATRGHRVVAFEPEAQNFAQLCRNLSLNGVGDRVTCLPIALSDSSGLDRLYLSRLGAGMALNTVGAAVNWQHQPFEPVFAQSVLRFSLDGLIAEFGVPFPTHLKLDVDGAENQVLAGAERTLRDPRLRSLLIELNDALPADRRVAERLREAGFQEELRARSPLSNAASAQDTVYNYVFRRQPA